MTDDVFEVHIVLETYWWACIVGMRVADDHHMSKRIVVGNYRLALQYSHGSNLPGYSPTAGTKTPEDTSPIYCRTHDECTKVKKYRVRMIDVDNFRVGHHSLFGRE